MAHDNFEEILKRRLEERRMEPTGNAWERINGRKKPAKKRSALLYWIPAACIAVLAGWFLLDQETGTLQVPANKVEVTENDTTVPESDTTAAKVFAIPSKPVVETPAVAVQSKDSVVTSSPQEIAVAAPTAEKQPLNEERKINEIISELDQLQQSGQAITEATVDSLLAKAQRELALEKQQRRGTDPDKLLAESERELDMSFKDRVFAAINKFKKVRIAVGDH